MSQLTITEGLAELKTLRKRVEKKQDYIGTFLARQDGVKDPLEKEGGASAVIVKERQAISDLNRRHVKIRTEIQKVNQSTSITIEGEEMTIAEWLTWRKEIAPDVRRFLDKIKGSINNLRSTAQKQGLNVVKDPSIAGHPTDYVINVDEAELAKQIEHIETVLGTLDGQLSLKNATTMIEV